MTSEPNFVSIGNRIEDIGVHLSYKIVELFSEGLYASPNKAIEELVTNSFDAGARSVHVLLSPDIQVQGATIVVIDDGEGMDEGGLKQHWLIGESNKRKLKERPRERKQIGKFGIGKLSTYVLANRLTHISKRGGKYYSASMDYRVMDHQADLSIQPTTPIQIALRELTAKQAQQAVMKWTESNKFKTTGMTLFGKDSSQSWTISIMSELKPKVQDIQPGRLRWILRTALPLRPDFAIWLGGEKLEPSKTGENLIKKLVIGKDLIKLNQPAPQDITESVSETLPESSKHKYGINVSQLERITGYAEVYKDPLRGKSDEIGRSNGFFVYANERLLNEDDGHFGISPNELRHGTFNRFRLVIYMDVLDKGLRSNREAIEEGPLLVTARNILRSIFNTMRQEVETYDRGERSVDKLSRKLAASPSSLSRGPIVELATAVSEGKAKAYYLAVPHHDSEDERIKFLEDLKRRADEAENFVVKLDINHDATLCDGIVKYDTETGILWLNASHPFVATFYDEYTSGTQKHPMELLAMAEVIAESHLHSIGIDGSEIDEFLTARDQLLRYLADGSGRKSVLLIASDLLNARNNSNLLEKCVCDAFASLGFVSQHMGGSNKPDGIATASLPATEVGTSRSYKVCLEAKSTMSDGKKISASSVGISTIVRHRDNHDCNHAVIVGPAFQTSKGDASALGESIDSDRDKSKTKGENRTITLMTIDDLAQLVRLRPVKRIGLSKIRRLFETCSLPEQSAKWIKEIQEERVETPDYRRILEAVDNIQKKFDKELVKYASLRTELAHQDSPIKYDTDNELMEVCKGMAQMATGSFWAYSDKVELDQSIDNVMKDIMDAIKVQPVQEIGEGDDAASF